MSSDLPAVLCVQLRLPILWRLFACFAGTFIIATAHAAPPNIVFVLVDDLGWKDVGCCGNSFVETPNLDRLASEGMRFTHAYMLTVCSPSRAALLTGMHPVRVGITEYLG